MPVPLVLVRHPACFAHDTGAGHPEAPARLRGILDAVQADPDLAGLLVEMDALPVEAEYLVRAHTEDHVSFVRDLADRARRHGRIEWIDPDTAVSAKSFLAAVAAAGCAATAAELVATGHARTAFALARPPGHHAHAQRASGFCLFNNVMVAARRLQSLGLARRILIVDWDVHHGDGTQAIAWEDPDTYYLSLHLSPHYPGTGAAGERGGAAAVGAVRNVPLPHGTSRAEYRRRFSDALGSSLDEFEPDLVFMSAGFDCLAGDPLGGLLLEPEDLHAITEEIAERTRSSAEGRVVAVLEGGYVPERIGAGAANVMRALAGLPAGSVAQAPGFRPHPNTPGF
jgi:acetoin utilization deacetylase AcuC-like enzyme